MAASTSSTHSPSFDLQNTKYFPSYRDLPLDRNIDEAFYKLSRDGIYRPSHHWVFLAEIVENQTMRLSADLYIIRGGGLGIERPRYLVRDRHGEEIKVAFHTEPVDMMMYGFDENKYAVGNTLAVFYANGHWFMDGTEGLRIEELTNVKVIPCSLQTLLDANSASIAATTSCKHCNQEKDHILVCSNCKTKYCSQKCQRADWKGHKPACAAIRHVREWKQRDWRSFDGCWEETSILDGLKLAGGGKGRRYP